MMDLSLPEMMALSSLDAAALTEAVDGGAPRELWTASLFPADLGLPPSGPGRIPSGLGLRLTGTGVPAPVEVMRAAVNDAG